jgi:transposase-like protein
VALAATHEAGAVAQLLQRYFERRGASPSRLAKSLGVNSRQMYALTNGWNENGTKSLGLIARTAETPLLVRVVEALAIPRDEVLDALASDLGFGLAPDTRAVSSTVVTFPLPRRHLRAVS